MKRLGILSNLQAQTPDTTEHADRWREHAACGTTPDPEIFFAIGESPRALQQTEDAKRICHSCPVMDRCLTWAIKHGQDAGVWGGLDEQQRRRLHGRRSSVAGPPKPPRTPATVLADKSQEVPGGHVVWSGNQPVFVNGEEYTAPQLAWVVAYGQRPDSPLTVACGHPGCIRADHRLDAAGRAALHGTRAAYLAHRRRNEPACEPCLIANRDNHKQKQERRGPRCGTQAAYRKHHANGEPPCQRCKDAHARTNRRLREAAKKRTPKPVKTVKPKAVKAPRPARTAKPTPTPAPRVVVQCGTNSGYHSHRNKDEPVCEPCRAAHAASSRAYRVNEKAKPPTPGPDCGTRSGSRAHLSRGEVPCQPCADARARADWLLNTTPERSAA